MPAERLCGAGAVPAECHGGRGIREMPLRARRRRGALHPVSAELFASATEYYDRYRPGYPDGLFSEFADRLGLDGSQVAVDVGCGTGQVAIPLAGHVRRVIAIDPLPRMLALGAAAARRRGVANVDWRLGDSTGLARLGVEGADLVVFAASFHWTDRPAVTRELAGLVAVLAPLVVVTDGLGQDEDPEWVRAIADVRARYLGPVRRAGSGVYVRPQGSHEQVLRESPFSSVERLCWRWERSLTVAQVVGLQFSYSFSTPALLGDDAAAFAADVRDAVLALHPDGTVVEPLRAEVLIARRP